MPGTPPLLSIGQVLARLTAEFPDLTPSKLRFLEERRLISPARTESGYRKFSPADLERLRFVLTMQRDHYLPLKVIRGYLDDLDAGRQPDAARAARRRAVHAVHGAAAQPRRAHPRGRGDTALLDDAICASLIVPAEHYGEESLAVLALAGGAAALRNRTAAPAWVPGRRRARARPHRERADPGRAPKDVVEPGEGERTCAEIAGQLEVVRGSLIRSALSRLDP